MRNKIHFYSMLCGKRQFRLNQLRIFTNVCLAIWASSAILETPICSQEIDFNRDVRPILSDHCFKCHGPDESSREADLRLDEPEAAEHVLQLDDEEVAELVRRIQSDDSDEKMPPPASKLKLSKSEIETLEKWVQQGGKYVGHWAFQSIRKPKVPRMPENYTWPKNEIDLFVLQTAESKNLVPREPAAKERLMRRVYFDLTGLPPTLNDIDPFVTSSDPNAFEKLVDRLLASQEFGERMASDWLDAARYSDSYGYQVDRDRFVWPWRDWVIKAINDNLPYDQFIQWQLAGDLLPNATYDQKLATTFNRLHPQKVEGGSVPEEFRVEYVADRTHTVATAFLGLTFECARCHDHKYDPISQKEYYQLFAFFNNIDEAGLYSYFTNSIPTPTLLMTSPEQEQQIKDWNAKIKRLEMELANWSDDEQKFNSWLDGPHEGNPVQGEIKHQTFEGYKGANKSVPGKVGKAVELTGDDAIGLDVGNFPRFAPFSVSLWIKIPKRMDRAVVFHRSRAWTDSASRGYQLLVEAGKLSASLIHFWPGNAIRVKTKNEVPINQWHQVTVTYDGSSTAAGLKIHMDGELAESEVVRDNLYKNITGSGGDNISIGQRFRDKGFTKGQVDEFRVFNRELTRLEIAQLFDATTLTKSLQQKNANDRVKMDQLRAYYRHNHDQDFKQQLNHLRGLREKKFKLIDGIQEIMVMAELPERRQTYLLKRGAYNAPGPEVQPDTPGALPRLPEGAPHNRLGLATWLTHPSNPLTARVAVNRFWKICFGKGLVATPEDFGSQGSAPTHPKLLDWLAADFVENGWNVKRLMKQMVMSSTYQQESQLTAEQWKQDPQNQFLARAPRYRLSAEMLRDNILAVSGLLVKQVGGASVRPYEVSVSFKPVGHDKGDGLYRRSLYTYWRRTAPAPVMMALDAAKRDVCSVKRERTSSPQQAFVFMNDPQFVEGCRMLAERIIEKHEDNVSAALRELFRVLTGRQPSSRELEILSTSYAEQHEYFKADKNRSTDLLKTGNRPRNEKLNAAQVAAFTMVTNTLINFDEVVMKR